jgi:hypothetical protein
MLAFLCLTAPVSYRLDWLCANRMTFLMAVTAKHNKIIRQGIEPIWTIKFVMRLQSIRAAAISAFPGRLADMPGKLLPEVSLAECCVSLSAGSSGKVSTVLNYDVH